MEQGATRRLAATDALQLIHAGVGAQMLRLQVRVIHHLLDALNRREDFGQAGVVVEEGGVDRSSAKLAEFNPCFRTDSDAPVGRRDRCHRGSPTGGSRAISDTTTTR